MLSGVHFIYRYLFNFRYFVMSQHSLHAMKIKPPCCRLVLICEFSNPAHSSYLAKSAYPPGEVLSEMRSFGRYKINFFRPDLFALETLPLTSKKLNKTS